MSIRDAQLPPILTAVAIAFGGTVGGTEVGGTVGGTEVSVVPWKPHPPVNKTRVVVRITNHNRLFLLIISSFFRRSRVEA
jgi:hypothetical protein